MRLEVVRDLAQDIGLQLGAIACLARENNAPDVLAEAALRCADLANLAACNVSELNPEEAKRAIEAARGRGGSRPPLSGRGRKRGS